MPGTYAPTVIDRTATNRYLGVCAPCNRPLAVEVEAQGRTVTEKCAECAQPVTLERLVAVTTIDICDASCMGAIGPNCSCGCGGANHGRSFVTTRTHYEIEKAVKKYRAASAKRSEAAKKAAATKAANKAADKKARIADWFAGLEGDEAAAIEWLTATDGESMSSFLWDMRDYVVRFKNGLSRYDAPLTERQLAATVKCYKREMEWAARQAQREAERAAEAAAALPVPLGNGITVEGEIVSVKTKEEYYGGREKVTHKMLVKGADGWKVWATVPVSLLTSIMLKGGSSKDLVGRQVRFVANVELGKDESDVSFGVGRFIRRAKLTD